MHRNNWQKTCVYHALAAGVRLLAKTAWSEESEQKGEEDDGKLSPTPKKIVKLIAKNPVFRTILLEKAATGATEELTNLPLARLKG